MPSVVKVLKHDDSFVVQLTENGIMTEKVFVDEAHAKSFAAGQQFRMLHTGDDVTEDLARAYGKH